MIPIRVGLGDCEQERLSHPPLVRPPGQTAIGPIHAVVERELDLTVELSIDVPPLDTNRRRPREEESPRLRLRCDVDEHYLGRNAVRLPLARRRDRQHGPIVAGKDLEMDQIRGCGTQACPPPQVSISTTPLTLRSPVPSAIPRSRDYPSKGVPRASETLERPLENGIAAGEVLGRSQVDPNVGLNGESAILRPRRRS